MARTSYVTNPDADVAVMYGKLPTTVQFPLIPISVLADDFSLEALKIHPGDVLLCLGFPLFVDSNTFPIIRSGILASYPITPSETVKRYYYDFHIFPGNSGGPVYFDYGGARSMGGGVVTLGTEEGIIGLVSQQVTSNLPNYKGVSLDVSIIVPSSYIKDTISLLPSR